LDVADLDPADELVIVHAGTTWKVTYGDLVADALAAEATARADGDTNTLSDAEDYVDAPMTLNQQNSAYTIDPTDMGNVMIEATGGSLQTFTIPEFSPILPHGATGAAAFRINVIGAGGVHIATSGAALAVGTTTDLAQGESRTFYQRTTNHWWGMQ
jgi:hypothetical protein